MPELTGFALSAVAERQFGDMAKAAVDVGRGVMAIGGELHSDEEAVLLEDGAIQADIRGINIYPAEAGDTWIEFNSMINVRPSATTVRAALTMRQSAREFGAWSTR